MDILGFTITRKPKRKDKNPGCRTEEDSYEEQQQPKNPGKASGGSGESQPKKEEEEEIQNKEELTRVMQREEEERASNHRWNRPEDLLSISSEQTQLWEVGNTVYFFERASGKWTKGRIRAKTPAFYSIEHNGLLIVTHITDTRGINDEMQAMQAQPS